MLAFGRLASFQYNSCYCLSGWRRSWKNCIYRISIQLLLLFISPGLPQTAHPLCYFNTTLVIVYRQKDAGTERSRIFQYNSCYCLSNAFKPFLFFIIASFPDKINVSLNFSQPSSVFSHFSPIYLQMAISRGLYAIINFIGWEISMTFSTWFPFGS